MAGHISNKQGGARGFTLVEILIAIFILSVVMTTVYVSYSSVLKTSRDMEEELAAYKMARTTLDRLVKDLSSLQASSGAFDFRAAGQTIRRRDFHSLAFWAASHLDFTENQGAERPAAIAYSVRENDTNDGFSLWRSDTPGGKPDDIRDKDRGFVICRNIEAFRLTFYDTAGSESDAWDSSARLQGREGKAPKIVKIELAVANPHNPERPYTFMTKVLHPVKR